MLYAKVAIDLQTISDEVDYYYLIPEELKKDIKEGSAVFIPFGKQETNGFVVNITNAVAKQASSKNIQYKPIYGLSYKNPIWDEKFLKLAKWMSKYYKTNLGTILSASVSNDIIENFVHEVSLLNENFNVHEFSSEQQLLLNKLLQSRKKSLSYKYLAQKTKLSKQKFYQLLNQLKSKGIIEIKNKKKTTPKWTKNFFSEIDSLKDEDINNNIILNKEQDFAFNQIASSLSNQSKNNIFLLHGVTGSGKTEIYLKLLENILSNKKSAIYLVPEIYLVPQTYQRLKSRFPETPIVLWHSHLTKQERFNFWETLQNNEENKTSVIILGARSAILAPVKNIGLIVVDESHETTYKQSAQAPRYDAIRVAIERGKIEKCPVILGSATPNTNDYYFCLKNHEVLTLPNRIQDIPMPEINIINLKNQYPKTYRSNISNELKSAINEALSKNEQIILLLNRRGYSSHIFCRACGFTLYCKNCSVPLVFHKHSNLVVCHHCGYNTHHMESQSSYSTICPDCKSPHLKYFGLGTQQLEEEVIKTFKEAKVIRVDSDKLKRKNEYINLWRDFASHKADILIGTQLVAKGLDIRNVTVVGVILADTMLNFPDYISHERTFQLLTQVAGRAGRRDKPGKVFIQSYKTEEQIFDFVKEHNYKGFFENEIKNREELYYPPFCNLIRIIFQSFDEKECLNYAAETHKKLDAFHPKSKIQNPQFLGPAPCFFNKLHGKYRYHILCKVKDENQKELLFNNILNKLPQNAKVDMVIDIDSINLL